MLAPHVAEPSLDSKALLVDLHRLLRELEVDLRERIEQIPTLDTSLKSEWQKARAAGRSAAAYAAWCDEEITQAAVHWVLACTFIRFLEDNDLVERPYLSGPTAERRMLANDRHEAYFRTHPLHSDREYLEHCFAEVAALPAMAALFDPRHNPIWRLGVSADGAKELREFWQRIDPDTGWLKHDFTDPTWNTRFLGDLYQDLSEAARKRYALLQTPEFVEEFILERTLDPAIAQFGYRAVRLIDPACGSGHFLLGAFWRLFDLWARNEPARNLGDLAQCALNGVFGVDLNPFSIAIARFRLLLAALRACNVIRLKDAPAFRIHVTVGDSLLHGRRFGELDLGGEAENLGNLRRGTLGHAYQVEDIDELNRILGQQYHAVVGNPPYITVKDAALNQAYRQRYSACHRQYSLVVPFTQRFFDLALPPLPRHPGESRSPESSGAILDSGLRRNDEIGGLGAGFVGMITANSFMKREFGKKLIEEFLPKVDLTHVIDTSGAYIPGHGTPTVILFGRNRRPVASTVRTVMGIKGEPEMPKTPSKGLVWNAIMEQVEQAGSKSEFLSVSDTRKAMLAKHPWSIGGGGAADLKDFIDEKKKNLGDYCLAIGRTTVVGEDDIWIIDRSSAQRLRIVEHVIPLAIGERVRDWRVFDLPFVVYPYKELAGDPVDSDSYLTKRYLWFYRTLLVNRSVFGKTLDEMGRSWYEHLEHYRDKLSTYFSITFAFVATHNHFVLDRGGKVFNRSAPVIKLKPGATEDDYLALLGLLNSSMACFWGRQTFFPKGGFAGGKWEERLEWDGTKIQKFPLAEPYPTDLARQLDALARELSSCLPSALLKPAPENPLPSPWQGEGEGGGWVAGIKGEGVMRLTRVALEEARQKTESLRRQMIAWQEELDWRCYRLYGLLDKPLEHPNPPEINLGERAFEIVMARQMAHGELNTTWFERHSSLPVTELPRHWPEDYQRVVKERIRLIESDRNINLIERPEYKRRWQWIPWEERERTALRAWLLDRLEDPRYWSGAPRLTSVRRLADRAAQDAAFMEVAALYAGRADFDLSALVADLVESEAVPFLPVLRYTESGLRKRRQWEATWALQRKEDTIDARIELPEGNPQRLTPEEAGQLKRTEVGDIPVPPKYRSQDFRNGVFWRLRGGLDVPKERFVSYPYCERDADGSLVVAWAGWGHLEQAMALASYYIDMKEREGWGQERLKPLLTGVLEFLPWLKQWHNDYNVEYGQRMGDYFADFVAAEARALGLTEDDLRGWSPPVTSARQRRTRTGQVTL